MDIKCEKSNVQIFDCSTTPRLMQKLEETKSIIAKLDTIIQRLSEDNLDDKISYKQLTSQSATYDADQKVLEQRKTEL